MRKLLGVGINDCRGWSNYRDHPDSLEYRIYRSWHDMVTRCYSESFHKRSPTYIGCTVCERWLTLSNFAEDIKYLPNYDKYVSGECPVLDKDIRVPGNKEYSLQTCMFVSKADSILDVHRNHSGRIHSKEALNKVSKALSTRVRITDSRTGEVSIFESVTKASEFIKTSTSNVSQVCYGRRSTIKGLNVSL